ncbi:MAG: signal peptide peptidase SppA [Vicinamibacteria bacterium]
MERRHGRLRRFFTRGLWVVDLTRRLVLNGLFVLVALVLLAAMMSGGTKVPKDAVLVVDPRGEIVEQLSGSPAQRARARLSGNPLRETLLKDVLDAIRQAKDDKRIKVLLLDVDGFGGAGLTKLQDLRAAVRDFKKSGKRVVAAADGYNQSQYHLAATADEVFLHEAGLLLIEGYGRFPTFYKEGIDKLEADWNVFRVGEYKSAVEPFLRNDMSPEAKAANREYLDDLWRSWLKDVAEDRKLTPEALAGVIDGMVGLLRDADGDVALVARETGLVDQTGGRGDLEKRLIALSSEDEDTHTYRRIGFRDYLKAGPRDRDGSAGRGEAVAVVVAKGSILDGSQPPGEIGGDSTAALIRKARLDEKVKAVVLRVDSGGGSSFASEVIREELARVRADKKPVVVSMGSVAASGGYWIATSSDEVWASPATITGSIGIFGMFPTFQKPLAKHLGMRVDGVGTTWLSGALRPDVEMKPELKEAFQTIIDRGYEDFLDRVAHARKMDRDAVDRIARGRVWSGEDAKQIGLVDQLGGLDQAVTAAAKRAQLKEGYRVWYVEKEGDWSESLAATWLQVAADLAAPEPATPPAPGRVESWARGLQARAAAFARFNDPRGVYAACLCEVE